MFLVYEKNYNKENDIQKAKDFITEHFGNPECKVAKEHYNGCFCNLEYI